MVNQLAEIFNISDVLKGVLHRKTALLFLDNCENLPDACVHLIEDLIEHCPHLRILTTCRELLKMEGEATYYLPSLSTPKRNIPLEKIAKYESVQFSIERAALALTTFQLTRENAQFMADICGRLMEFH